MFKLEEFLADDIIQNLLRELVKEKAINAIYIIGGLAHRKYSYRDIDIYIQSEDTIKAKALGTFDFVKTSFGGYYYIGKYGIDIYYGNKEDFGFDRPYIVLFNREDESNWLEVKQMINVGTRIKLGECNCFSFSEQLPHLCWKDRLMYLTTPKKYFKEMENLVESIVNHEVIHLVIDNIENKVVSKKFDYMFNYKLDLITRPDGTPNGEVNNG